MNSNELLSQFTALQPAFGDYWRSRLTGTTAPNGDIPIEAVLSRFADYFRQQHNHMSEDEVKAIASVISWCERDEKTKSAVYTYFLESIADNPPEATISPFLPRESIDFLSYWRSKRK